MGIVGGFSFGDSHFVQKSTLFFKKTWELDSILSILYTKKRIFCIFLLFLQDFLK